MTRTNKILLVAIAFVASAAAFWHFGLGPKREQAETLKTDIAAKQTELEQANRQIVEYEKAKESYKANYATVARLGKAVPTDDDVRSLLVQLNAEARRSGVDFRTIEVGGSSSRSAADAATEGVQPPPGATVGAGGFATMPFSFSFRGDFFSLSRFLTRVERFVTVKNKGIDVTGRLLLMDSISVKPDTDGFPSLRAQITANSYVVPPTAGVPGEKAGSASASGTSSAGGSAAGDDTIPTTTATATGAVR